MIVVASAGDGTVEFFGGADFAARGGLNLGDDADNIRVDPRNGHVVVGYGEGGLAIIDPATRTKLQDIKLPGHPESFQIDPQSNRAYVNVPDAGQIAVVDLATGRQVAKWTLPGRAQIFRWPSATSARQSPQFSARRRGSCSWIAGPAP